MSVTYQLNDEDCHCGMRWIFVKSSTLYPDYYYCKHCDSFFVPRTRRVSEEEINAEYCSDRAQEMKEYALLVEAKKKITYNDLVRLGYLELKENQNVQTRNSH